MLLGELNIRCGDWACLSEEGVIWVPEPCSRATLLTDTFRYMRADKDRGSGRLVGSGYALAEIALIGLCGKMAFDLIMA